MTELSRLRTRVYDLEVKVAALELALKTTERAVMSQLSDNPPTIVHQFAINRILEAGGQLALAGLHSDRQEVRELSGEILSWLEAMGRPVAVSANDPEPEPDPEPLAA